MHRSPLWQWCVAENHLGRGIKIYKSHQLIDSLQTVTTCCCNTLMTPLLVVLLLQSHTWFSEANLSSWGEWQSFVALLARSQSLSLEFGVIPPKIGAVPPKFGVSPPKSWGTLSKLRKYIYQSKKSFCNIK